MINYALIDALGLNSRQPLAPQLREKGFHDLGEWDAQWSEARERRASDSTEIYSSPTGYHLYVSTEKKTFHHTHSGD